MIARLRRIAGALTLSVASIITSATAAAAGPTSASASAGKAHTVLVLPLSAEGVLASDRTALQGRLDPAFEHPDIAVVSPGEVERCADDACLRELGREHGASHVIRSDVVADGRDYVAEIVVLAVDADGPATVIDAGCEICGLAEFGDRLAARAVAARDLVLAEPALGILEVVGAPADARVRIDGRMRGTLPFRGPLDVGEHELIVSADGHYRQIVPVEMLPGVERRLEVTLEPKPLADWRRGVGWGLLGGGVGSLVTGSVLIGVHGSPAALRCDGGPESVDADGDCRWLRRTRGAGIGLMVTGLAATAAGGGLLIIDTRRRRAHERADQRDAELRARVGLTRIDLQLRF